MKYFATLKKTEGIYHVSLPDFENINTYGNTKEDALKNAEEALRERQDLSPAAAIETMMNPLANDQEKATAWGQVRANPAEYWTDTIVREAVWIGATSLDAQVRADIWRHAHANHTHPLLLQPLLQALASDPDRSVREEAAETLYLYLDQPGVREALRVASQYDADSGVRRQAEVSLAGPQGGF